MRRFVSIGALCAVVWTGAVVHAMPIGVRLAMQGRAAARQAVPATYSVFFHANGGTGGKTLTVPGGASLGTYMDKVSPKRDGYVLDGWFTAADGGVAIMENTVVTSDVTFYAHWTLIEPVPVTPDPVTPDPVTPDPVTPDPVTPDPVTPDPVSPDPVTPDPVTPDPVTPDLVTPDPVSPDPVTSDSVTPDPVTPDPVTPDLVTPDLTDGVEEVAYGGVVDNVSFSKAQTVTGALYDDKGLFVGVVELKFGKISKKKTVKVSASVTMLDGGKSKKVTAKAATLELKGGTMPGRLTFKKPIENLVFYMDADGTFTLLGNGYEMREAEVGTEGALSNGSHTFTLEGFDLNVPGELQKDLLPDGETFKVSGKKWTFNKAATVKVAKDKKTKAYELVVDTSKGKTNLSGLKLTYTANTGLFKGSFKVYAVEEAKGGQKKLKKYTVNVIGFVVGGEGAGQASIKKPAGGPWAVTLESE